MKTTVQELKELYAKLGGTADISGVQTDAGMIDAIDSVAGGGGSLSPATADTLGGVKIGSGISVTDDGTSSASGGGGGSSAVVLSLNDATYDGDASTYTFSNITVGDIVNAYKAGANVVVSFADDGNTLYGNMLELVEQEADDNYAVYGTLAGNMSSYVLTAPLPDAEPFASMEELYASNAVFYIG